MYGMNKSKAKFLIPENDTIIENSIYRYAINTTLKMIVGDAYFMFYHNKTENSIKNIFLEKEDILKKYQLFIDDLK